ncbi:MAG: hypothetical protein JSW39_27940 [Desulfobacterales bacterium]|nr:MAG: hypothetical protein JSW39_27940 [Desulfobacterales bacterium]
MKLPNRATCIISLTSIVVGISFALGVAASGVVKAQLPAVITSLGQSPDGYTASVLAKRAQLQIEYKNLMPAEEVSNYKTVIMAVGASLKGFGSAGVNLDTELKRGAEIVKACKDQNVLLVIFHTGGEGRREQMSNRLLDTVAAKANYLVVLEESNQDEYFTNVSRENNIPITVVESVIKIQDILKEMFGGQ